MPFILPILRDALGFFTQSLAEIGKLRGVGFFVFVTNSANDHEMFLCYVIDSFSLPPEIFVGAGHALRLHCGFIFIGKTCC
jgi:hypothetical protein